MPLVFKIIISLIHHTECNSRQSPLNPNQGHNFCDTCKTGSECAVCGVVIMEEHRNVEMENMEAVL